MSPTVHFNGTYIKLLNNEVAEVVAGKSFGRQADIGGAVFEKPLRQVAGIFQERSGTPYALERASKQPRRLLDVIKLSSATGFFPENVINVFEGLLKHEKRRAGKPTAVFLGATLRNKRNNRWSAYLDSLIPPLPLRKTSQGSTRQN